jgi:sigma-B regulation protein RsbU (phosphoserine phosphatase)
MKPNAQSTLTEHRITVLLIDDQAMVGEAVRRMLSEEQDIDFHFVSDPSKALQTAIDLEPTVILQDLVMPEIDGLTLVKFMRKNPALQNTPLIVLSSKEEAVTKAEAFALGANDYLVKLPDSIELIARIRYHSKAYINLLQRNEAYEALLESQQELKKELARAADYVVSQLPAPLEDPPVAAQWRFIPSTSLGGDSFGYHWLDDDHFAMFLLDVCDHGVGSALLSVSAMNVIGAQTLPDADFRDPAQVLTALNNTFQMDRHNNLYFTLWYGVWNRKTNQLAYASGGHPPALLIQERDGERVVSELRTKNLFIGGMPDMEFTSDQVELAPPARLFLYSDGVYELKKVSDGLMWEFHEFRDFMTEPPPAGENAMDRLIEHTKELQGCDAYEDDFSIVELDFQKPPSGESG